MGNDTSARNCTFEDFCRVVGDDRKADLIDGVIHYEGPEDPETNLLHLWLLCLVNVFVEAKRLGRVFSFKVAFRLDDLNGPEPDVAFIRAERAHVVEREYVDGRPDLVMEIVSPETVEQDYRLKREQYRRAGVPEFWLVDEAERKVVLLRLADDRKYREVRPRKGVLASQVMPGFWLRPEWLWQTPRPKKTDILKQLLS
jgi:Uma2 family endonuclease